jgi:hypothetical protein
MVTVPRLVPKATGITLMPSLSDSQAFPSTVAVKLCCALTVAATPEAAITSAWSNAMDRTERFERIECMMSGSGRCVCWANAITVYEAITAPHCMIRKSRTTDYSGRVANRFAVQNEVVSKTKNARRSAACDVAIAWNLSEFF